MQLNQTKLEEVAQAAAERAAASGDKDAKRWMSAIRKASVQLAENPFISLDAEGLLILSPDSLQIYKANGTCQCTAAVRFGTPCWHRAAYRLAKLYTEATGH
ncbi:MAG TPA: hypothetical protein VIQ24_24270 [Pyrinomonadaceae bacterium]